MTNILFSKNYHAIEENFTPKMIDSYDLPWPKLEESSGSSLYYIMLDGNGTTLKWQQFLRFPTRNLNFFLNCQVMNLVVLWIHNCHLGIPFRNSPKQSYILRKTFPMSNHTIVLIKGIFVSFLKCFNNQKLNCQFDSQPFF